jgi:hypothetical protein
MGKSKKRKASANASSDTSDLKNVSTVSDSASDVQNKSILSNILSATNSVLYGSPNKEEDKQAAPLTSTPKWPQTGSTGSGAADSTNTQNLELIKSTIAETNRKLDSVLGWIK